MSEKKKPVCLAPWTQHCLTTTGKFKLCCIHEYENKFDASSFKEAWNHSTMKQARLDLLDGKFPVGCDQCSKVGVSNTAVLGYKRFDRFERFVGDVSAKTEADGSYPWEPISLDIRNHHCNLKCRTCSSENSTAIMNERKTYKISFGSAYNISNLDELTDEQYHRLQDIYWSGGEPFMSPLHWNIMDHLVKIGKTDLYTTYNTNGTFPGKTLDRAIKLLSRFKKVDFRFSLDGVDEIGEYIRDGLKFNEFESNIQRLRTELPKAKYLIDVTLTSIGLVNLPDLIRWCDSINIKCIIRRMNARLTTNNHLDIYALKPEVFLDLIAEARITIKTATNINKIELLENLTHIEKYYKQVKFDRANLEQIEKQRGKVGFFDSIMSGKLNE